MKKFLVLYRSNVPTTDRMATATPEQQQTMMAAWRAWAERSGASLVLLGAPLGAPTVLKGGVGTGFVGGFSIVQADSTEAGKRLFDGHPHLEFPGNSIELLEHLPMPGA